MLASDGEMAEPSTTSAHAYSASPLDYQALGVPTTVATDDARICASVGSATIEVTALAPDLFRVGLFPHGRAVDYGSVAVVAQDWHPRPATTVQEAGKV